MSVVFDEKMQRVAMLRIGLEQASRVKRVMWQSRLSVLERDVRRWSPERKDRLEAEVEMLRASGVQIR
jgi:hypothetical protein